MQRNRKLILAAGGMLILALCLWSLALWRPLPDTRGTAVPPPGPHQAGDIWLADLDGKTTMEMVWCPPGKFLMGSPVTEKDRERSEIQHNVTLTRGFWLGRTEVTQAQWWALMASIPSGFPRQQVVRKRLWKWDVPVWRRDFLVNRWQLPVEQVSWDDCQAFCKRAGAGFRLPTEAEWEYACRAGAMGAVAGNGNLDRMGWYNGNSGSKTHKVARKTPNAWGLFDMHGNVREWCQDWFYRNWQENPSRPVTDPVGPPQTDWYGHVCRGGSYGGTCAQCRCASNDSTFSFSPADGSYGLRLAFSELPYPGPRPRLVSVTMKHVGGWHPNILQELTVDANGRFHWMKDDVKGIRILKGIIPQNQLQSLMEQISLQRMAGGAMDAGTVAIEWRYANGEAFSKFSSDPQDAGCQRILNLIETLVEACREDRQPSAEMLESLLPGYLIKWPELPGDQ